MFSISLSHRKKNVRISFCKTKHLQAKQMTKLNQPKVLSTLPVWVVLAFLLHATFNIVWVLQDNAFASFPHYYHYGAISLFKHYVNLRFEIIFRQSFCSTLDHIFAFTCWVLGLNKITFILPITAFLGVLMAGIWRLCRKHLAMDHNTAQLAAIVLSLYPAVFGYSRSYNFTLVLLALVVLNTLFAFNVFKNADLKSVLWWLITFIAGFRLEPHHTETEAAIFVFGISGPFVYLVITWLRDKNKTRRQNLLNISVLGLFAASVPLMMATQHWGISDYLHYVFDESRLYNPEQASNQTPAGWFVNLVMLPAEQIGIYWSTVLAATTLAVVKRPKQTAVLFIWALVPLVITAFFAKKNSLYSIPVIIPCAIISALGLGTLKSTPWKKTLIAAIVMLGIAQYAILSFAPADNLARQLAFGPRHFADHQVQNRINFTPAPFTYTPAQQEFIDGTIQIIKPRLGFCPPEHLGVLNMDGAGQGNFQKVALGVYMALKPNNIPQPYFFVKSVLYPSRKLVKSYCNISRLYWLVDENAVKYLRQHNPSRLKQLGNQELCIKDGKHEYRLFCPGKPQAE